MSLRYSEHAAREERAGLGESAVVMRLLFDPVRRLAAQRKRARDLALKSRFTGRTALTRTRTDDPKCPPHTPFFCQARSRRSHS